MSFIYRFSLLLMCIFVFQNCGSFKSARSVSLYRYSSAPDFFYDVKLVSKTTDDLGRDLYVFDIAMSYVHDPTQPVAYRLRFGTEDSSEICQSIEGTAEDETKHFRAQCLLPPADGLFIQLALTGPQNEIETFEWAY